MIKEYGYEYDAVLNKELYQITKGKITHNYFMGALCLRSGRDALKVVAREFQPTDVLMPALACNSMILPFEMYGHTVKYYKLNKDYSIDIESLYSLIANKNKEFIFLYMDYFGNKGITDETLNEFKEKYPSSILVKDITHNLLKKSDCIFKPDFVIASIRKWLNIPDGGLLWTERRIKNTKYGVSLSFFETRLEAQCMRNEFLQTGNEVLKCNYRKVFSTVTDIIDEERLPGLMSAYSYEILKKENLKMIDDIRCRNAEILISELEGFEFVQNKAGLGDVYVAILIKNRDTVQKKLASIGIFCTIIWPLNDIQKAACKVAKYTEENILTIYCDQRYTIEDMKYVANCIRRICGE